MQTTGCPEIASPATEKKKGKATSQMFFHSVTCNRKSFSLRQRCLATLNASPWRRKLLARQDVQGKRQRSGGAELIQAVY